MAHPAALFLVKSPFAGIKIRHGFGQAAAVARTEAAPDPVQFQLTEEVELDAHQVVARIGFPSHKEIQVQLGWHSTGTHAGMLRHHRLIR